MYALLPIPSSSHNVKLPIPPKRDYMQQRSYVPQRHK